MYTFPYKLVGVNIASLVALGSKIKSDKICILIWLLYKIYWR
jgi:hypothetical protein